MSESPSLEERMKAPMTPAQPAPDHEVAKHWAEYVIKFPDPEGQNEASWQKLARSYLTRCAEVEALTKERDDARNDALEYHRSRLAFENQFTAHKATAARLAKALEKAAHYINTHHDSRVLSGRLLGEINQALSEAKPPEAKQHKWVGGNDISWCRVCGVEYDYRKEPEPTTPCVSEAKPLPTPSRMDNPDD